MRPRCLAVLVSILVLVLSAGSARAQTGGDIDLNGFRAAIDSRGYITANASQTLGHHELSFGLVTNWGYRVLALSAGDTSYTVENVITPSLQAAYGVRGLLELGVTMPFVIVNGDVNPDTDSGTPGNPNDDASFGFDAQGLGDVGLHAKLRLLDTSHHAVGVALLGSLYVPGGYPSGRWLGEDAVTFQPWLIVDREVAGGRLRLAGNFGLRLRGAAHTFENAPIAATMTKPMVPGTGETVTAGNELVFAGGLSYALVAQRFDLVGEVFGGVPLTGDHYQPLEAIAGVKLYLARNSFFLLGGGVGLAPGGAGGSPDARAFMGIVFEPNVGDRDGDGSKDDVDRCPDDPEDRDDFEDRDGCPDPDNDRDLILDVDDRCPNEPEDKDGTDDDDGCPERDELDRDGDRLNDDVDACPDDPEDFDQWQDGDGCPELDNDEDRILDVDDLCPNDAEDYDKWQDHNGCPEPDNDRDRILDRDDACPNEKESYNGTRDDDGCPDRGIVIRGGSGFITLDNVYFQTNKAVIKGQGSFDILDAVAASMIGNPDVLLLEVQGHTDSRNTAEYNRKLSQARAETVRQYLIDKGVEQDRLTAIGYGEDAPKEPCDERLQCGGKCKQACATNRRVEFIIRKQAAEE